MGHLGMRKVGLGWRVDRSRVDAKYRWMGRSIDALATDTR